MARTIRFQGSAEVLEDLKCYLTLSLEDSTGCDVCDKVLGLYGGRNRIVLRRLRKIRNTIEEGSVGCGARDKVLGFRGGSGRF